MIEVHIKKDERKMNFFQEHTSAILTFFVALSAVLVSVFQFMHTKGQAEVQKLMSERMYYNDSLKTLREFNQRVYEYKDAKRLALTKFISENESKLTSKDIGEREFFINLITSTYGEESIDLEPLLRKLGSGTTFKGDVKLLKKNVAEIRTDKLGQLYGPLVSGFAKGKSLYENYKKSNFSYRVAKRIAENDRSLLQLLLGNDALIPEYLKPDARSLVEHLSKWTASFDQMSREGVPSNENANFRVIYDGKTFPDLSAQRFKDEYYRLGGK